MKITGEKTRYNIVNDISRSLLLFYFPWILCYAKLNFNLVSKIQKTLDLFQSEVLGICFTKSNENEIHSFVKEDGLHVDGMISCSLKQFFAEYFHL